VSKKTRAGSLTRSRPSPEADESRAAVALTVGWMLSALSTLAALAVSGSTFLAMLAWPAPGAPAHPLAPLAGMMLLVAVTTGLVCLALTPLALLTRKGRPPIAVTLGAILIGVTPLVAFIVAAVVA
jgi:cytochrome c-type biogenesis protein CcmH/NrfG